MFVVLVVVGAGAGAAAAVDDVRVCVVVAAVDSAKSAHQFKARETTASSLPVEL